MKYYLLKITEKTCGYEFTSPLPVKISKKENLDEKIDEIMKNFRGEDNEKDEGEVYSCDDVIDYWLSDTIELTKNEFDVLSKFL